ncbi:MAG: response regulator [Desulfobacterales bacterium]|nr:response regulator [Desulfobacterales bacterium]
MKTRILLVDDEAEFVEQLAERLKLRDYDVSSCFSGEEAIEKIQAYNFDVVILDVAMPGIDGTEALGRIKALKPLTEVIMLTGHATVESAIEGMKLGAFDYLMKPCETSALIEKINSARQRKEAQEERIRQAKAEKYFNSPRSALKNDD